MPPDVWLVLAGFGLLWLYSCLSHWIAYDETEGDR